MSDRLSGGVADALADVGPALRGPEVGAEAAGHLKACRGTSDAKNVGLEVVVEQPVGVEVRSVGAQEDQLDAVGVLLATSSIQMASCGSHGTLPEAEIPPASSTESNERSAQEAVRARV